MNSMEKNDRIELDERDLEQISGGADGWQPCICPKCGKKMWGAIGALCPYCRKSKLYPA